MAHRHPLCRHPVAPSDRPKEPTLRAPAEALSAIHTPGDIIPECRATSSRNGGRHHRGIPGGFRSEQPGGIISEWWAASPGISTNIVERSIRPVVLNRKDALFAGHDEGAENWACIASLIETCKLHGVDPEAYMAAVLTRLVNLWPVARLDELMPWAWAPAHSANSLAA